MKDLYRVLAAEGLKLKRTLALRLAICGPMIIVLLVFGIYVQRGEKMGGANPLTGFAQLILTIWTIIMFPLYAALATQFGLAQLPHPEKELPPVRPEGVRSDRIEVRISLILPTSL